MIYEEFVTFSWKIHNQCITLDEDVFFWVLQPSPNCKKDSFVAVRLKGVAYFHNESEQNNEGKSNKMYNNVKYLPWFWKVQKDDFTTF